MILSDTAAEIPALNPDRERLLNKDARQISQHLVRLSNPPRHALLRQVAYGLLEKMQAVSIPEMVDQLLGEGVQLAGRAHALPGSPGISLDWVECVCKKLPLMVLAQGSGLSAHESDYIIGQIDSLVMLMAPDKNDRQIAAINDIAGPMTALSGKAVGGMGFSGEAREMALSNFLGLIIQSYDAGRGLLSNALLQILANPHLQKTYCKPPVIETLRFDPPVHHTRRIAARDLCIGQQRIKSGESILVMLAAANRDPQQFAAPDRFDIDRDNNHQHLTFGAGHHQCLAAHFSVHMATAALSHLFRRYGAIALADREITYEPRWNVRLPKEMWICLQP